MLPEIPREQLDAALELIAAEALAEGGWRGPPVDAQELAVRLGIVVARDGAGSGVRARFVRLSAAGEAQPAILVADDPRPERRQWAVAHEIGESRAHRAFGMLGVDPRETSPAARESIANALAGRLLLPARWFAAAGAAGQWDLCLLKEQFATASHELIARRMLEMAPGVIISLLDQGRLTWRRSNRLHRPPPLAPPERDAWLRAHATGHDAQCDAAELPEGVHDVRAWAIHEPDWKREIIRTELDDAS